MKTTTNRVVTPPTQVIALEKRASRRNSVLRRLLRDPQGVISGGLLIVIVLAGLFASFLAGHDPNDAQSAFVNAPLGTEGYPLGGDAQGRDITSRLLHSINTAIISALLCAGIALSLGTVLGLIAGYFGPRPRLVIEWVTNLIMTFPGILLLVILMPVTGGDYRLSMIIFGVLSCTATYRIVRNQVLGVKEELYVDAARVAGLSDMRIMFRHVLPVVRGPVIVSAAFVAGGAIGLQSGLAFLGLGSQLVPSFGSMTASGFTNLYIAPMQAVWPTLLLGIMTGALVLLGNSLRDAFEGSVPPPVKVGAGQRTAAQIAQSAPASRGALLEVDDLAIAYPAPDGQLVEVVHGVSFSLERGRTLGLVGESGSGKTQTAFSILGVLPPEAVITRGSIRFEGRQLLGMSDAELRSLRGTEIAYIPQEPMSNLDPSYTIGSQLMESLRASQRSLSKAEAKERILALLARCGIVDPERTFRSYPHEVSGGMAQRVLIAGAVASRPKLLIADEPTTALDVTVQAEILDLLRDLQATLEMTIVLVTHNFGVVADFSEELAVMKDGEIVETGTTRAIFAAPQHPYTRTLLDSILDEDVVRDDAPPAGKEVAR